MLSDLADLQLVADDHGGRNDADHAHDDEVHALERDVEAQRDEEPQQGDDARGFLVGDVPDQPGYAHGDEGAADAEDELEDGLACGGRHGDGDHDKRPDQALFNEELLSWAKEGDNSYTHRGTRGTETKG